jgi:hypothetical protein
MVFMLSLPILIAVAGMHRYLQRYAPSNLLACRVRTAVPTFRMGVALMACSAVLLVLMHVLAEAIAAGAPGWLNLAVLVLAWDVIKLTLVALVVAARSLAALLQHVGRRIAPQRSVWS